MSDQTRSTKLAIITALREVGGSASRTKLKELIAADPASGFTYNEVYDEVESKPSGEKYKPFDYEFNLGVKELEAIGYIQPPVGGASLVLTARGRTADLGQFPSAAEQRLMDDYWQSRKGLRARNAWRATAVAGDEASQDANALDSREEAWQGELIECLKQFTPLKFESFARLLISKMGVRIDKEKGIVASGDNGIDGFGYFESDEFRTARVAIQAKRYVKAAVSAPEIDNFRGVMDAHNAEYGIFITTTSFTAPAKRKAVQGTRTVTLIDGHRIAALVARYRLHVTPVQSYTLGDYYFEED
ncbi:restriction endonuclease [Lacticaseibacillus kribbianus]|uniref:restriction endonuclease n=1 Tax=Lacticaseibacillus kribbianus TaxID=2926292 RepID=UPI001CD302B8|nr:restriction endonuclease [Lacticaseibacillus kribbianus]